MDKQDPKVISIRRERNSDLIRRMRNGESLTSYDSAASWFPPRPVIEKDKNAMSQLYGKDKPRKSSGIAEAKDEQNEPKLVALPVAQ